MVNLTYACELDEVPHEAGRLIDDLCTKLTNVVAELKEASTYLLTKEEELKFGDAYSAIVNAKESMAGFDERLAAVLAILSGFYNAKTNPQREELTNETGELTSEISDKLSEIESQLQKTTEVLIEEDEDDEQL